MLTGFQKEILKDLLDEKIKKLRRNSNIISSKMEEESIDLVAGSEKLVSIHGAIEEYEVIKGALSN